MQNEMVERAKVAALVTLAEHGQTTALQEALVNGLGGWLKPGALDAMVRAVLAEMRKPTPSMRAACLRELSGATDFDPKVAAWDAQRGYRAMIDAALLP